MFPAAHVPPSVPRSPAAPGIHAGSGPGEFRAPLWLAAGIVAVPALAIGYLVAQRRTRRHTRRFVDPHLLDRIAPQRPRRSRHLPAA